MAAIANTVTTVAAVGNRESLSDVVSRITPEETPIYSMIEKGTAESVHPEWETDDLSPPGTNVQTEGDEYAFGAVLPPARMGNYTQIFRKEFIISNTQEAVKQAGNVQKRKYQKLKKGVELKKDVEFSILSNVGSVGGATRVSGGLPSWISTNASRGAGGANGGFVQGTGLTSPATNGTQRAFSKALMDGVAAQCYGAGANVSNLVVSPYVKSVFVTFMSDANVAAFRNNVSTTGKNTIVATADVYEGPYGKLTVQPNRVMSTNAAVARNAFFVDDDMAEFEWLRPIAEDPDIAKTGDAKKCVLIGEGTFKIKNEKGMGVVADIFGLTPTT